MTGLIKLANGRSSRALAHASLQPQPPPPHLPPQGQELAEAQFWRALATPAGLAVIMWRTHINRVLSPTTGKDTIPGVKVPKLEDGEAWTL